MPNRAIEGLKSYLGLGPKDIELPREGKRDPRLPKTHEEKMEELRKAGETLRSSLGTAKKLRKQYQ